jgi:magnesium-transporting ATPase (P-type)
MRCFFNKTGADAKKRNVVMTETNPMHTPAHAESIETVIDTLNTNRSGLSQAEAEARLARFGPNSLRPPKRRSAFMRFMLQFHNVLIYLLLVAGVITALLGHWLDSGVIFGVVVINALIGFIQEGKAERALEAIRNMLSPQALVHRDGVAIQIPAEEVVPGDVVIIQSGDKVPADLRLFQNKDAQIDESLLTGESLPVNKQTEAVKADVPLGDRTCLAFSGTLVTYGKAHGVVVATGDATELGRINKMLGEVQTLTTPLLRKLADFGRVLTIAICVIAALTFAYGLIVQGFSANDMFLSAVGLAVAAIPEGLPAIMTITLAIGVQRMAARHAIIRNLPAVETLGSVTVICSDKTGTLTCNQMTVTEVATNEGEFSVSGSGYNAHGDFVKNGEEVEPENYQILNELIHAALLCNDASLIRQENGDWQLQGDPTEGALVALALKGGLEQIHARESRFRADVVPFESERQFMATLHHASGNSVIYLKGAPEKILQRCSKHAGEGELQIEEWLAQMEKFAARGRRVLALACKNIDGEKQTLVESDLSEGFTLLGLTALMDPPRPEAIKAVARCREAGIRVKMITGDHAITARAIAMQMGLADDIKVLTGQEIERMDAAQLHVAVAETSVFARTSPEHKLRLVEALQVRGEVVAMTGDGVNDAPALKRADVGVAMGYKGSEAAKEAAEMVLANDNFASIAAAVEEGRTVYDNLKKAILFILPTNGGQALTIIAAIIMGRTLPITPVQILWVNMITAVTLALALAFEPAEGKVMQRPPRPPQEPLLSGFLLWRILFVSLILVFATFGLFLWVRAQGADIELARTVAVNTLVTCEIFYLFSARYIYDSALNREGLFGNRYVLIAIGLLIVMQLAFTYAPPMQLLFGTAPLSAQHWLVIICVSSSALWLVELEKAWLRKRRGRA